MAHVLSLVSEPGPTMEEGLGYDVGSKQGALAGWTGLVRVPVRPCAGAAAGRRTRSGRRDITGQARRPGRRQAGKGSGIHGTRGVARSKHFLV